MGGDRQRFGRGWAGIGLAGGAGEFAGGLVGPELTAVYPLDRVVPGMVLESGRRARNTYSRLSSVNGSWAKPP